MRYQTVIALSGPVDRLFEALVSRLPVELDATQVTHILAEGDDSAPLGTSHILSTVGHVRIEAIIGPEALGSASLLIDGNRRNVKIAQQVCEAWAAVFGEGADASDADASQALFEQALDAVG